MSHDNLLSRPCYKKVIFRMAESSCGTCFAPRLGQSTFHLGKDMLIRMPNDTDYALQVEKEQQWLPKLAPHLPILTSMLQCQAIHI